MISLIRSINTERQNSMFVAEAARVLIYMTFTIAAIISLIIGIAVGVYTSTVAGVLAGLIAGAILTMLSILFLRREFTKQPLL